MNESLSDDYQDQLTDYSSLKEEILDLVEKSVNSKSEDLVKEFIDSFITDNEDTNLEGLINDSDVYEFYLKYINDIDEILNGVDFFESSPASEGSLGLYDYLVSGTRKALLEVMKQIQEDIFGTS